MVDSGAAETVHTEDIVSKSQDRRIRRVQAKVLLHDGRRQHCGQENADHVNSRWVTTEESDLPSGQRQKDIWVSLEDGKAWRQSGVRCHMSDVQQDVQVQQVASRDEVKQWKHELSQALAEGSECQNKYTTNRSGASQSSSEIQQLRHERAHFDCS